jgi:FkbM family methyltransferase
MKLLIEVGAYDGHDSLSYHANGYRVFTFEPKRDLFKALYERTKHLNNYTVIEKAVCLTNGTTTFNICQAGGASSILPFRSNEELVRTWSANRTDVQYSGESYVVNTTRLDTFIEENSLQNETIDYIHIDAQGVDLEVLQSIGGYIKNVRAGVIETVVDPNKSIYRGQTTNVYSNVKEFLMSNGFLISGVTSNDNTACEYNVHFYRQ